MKVKKNCYHFIKIHKYLNYLSCKKITRIFSTLELCLNPIISNHLLFYSYYEKKLFYIYEYVLTVEYRIRTMQNCLL